MIYSSTISAPQGYCHTNLDRIQSICLRTSKQIKERACDTTLTSRQIVNRQDGNPKHRKITKSATNCKEILTNLIACEGSRACNKEWEDRNEFRATPTQACRNKSHYQ